MKAPMLMAILGHLTQNMACPECGTVVPKKDIDILVKKNNVLTCSAKCNKCGADIKLRGNGSMHVHQANSTNKSSESISQKDVYDIGRELSEFDGESLKDLLK